MRLSDTKEKYFVVRGFCNQKDATKQFTKHESSLFHKQAVDSLKNKSYVAEMLSSQHVEEKKGNQSFFPTCHHDNKISSLSRLSLER